jgi:hypothetical protein
MIITNEAKELLVDVFREHNAEGVRLYTVEGCCGPQFALSLDAPVKSDVIHTINGIKVAFDSEITETDELTLDREETPNGAGLVLIGGKSCSGDCDC